MHWLFVCCSILATSISRAVSLAPVVSEISLNHQPLFISPQGRHLETVPSEEFETCPFASFLKKQFNDLSWGLMSQCPHQKAALFVTCLTECERKMGGGRHWKANWALQLNNSPMRRPSAKGCYASLEPKTDSAMRASVFSVKNMTWSTAKTWSFGQHRGSHSSCCWRVSAPHLWPDSIAERTSCKRVWGASTGLWDWRSREMAGLDLKQSLHAAFR